MNDTIKKISKSLTAPLTAAVITAAAVAGAVSAQPPCVSFESPLAGSVFSAPSCTVSLKISCENVTKVDLLARYFPENSDSALIVSLGTITRPPYKLIWNTSNLPNQLFTGIGIVAEVFMGNATTAMARQEGIFLTHNKTERGLIPAPYALNPQHSLNDGAAARAFDLGDKQKAARSVVVWNEKGLVVHAAIKDNTFNIRESGGSMDSAGIEILIDPARRKAPHPADSVLFFFAPLSGSPSRIDHRADIGADGSFRLIRQRSRVDFPFNFGPHEFKGYDIQLTIPKETFGKTFPDTVGINIVLRMFDSAGHVRHIPLAGGNAREVYSPFTWPEYYRLPKPLYMNAGLQWSVFFVAGFLLSMIIYLIVSKLRKPQLLSNFERSEEEKSAFNRMNIVIEQELIKKDLSLEYVAQRSGITPQALNNLVKRNTGFSFAVYLQYCRTEVAKERLRSSRTSEKNIADLCGFASAMEMEKCFAKFHHTTPYKFRMQQQVA